MTALALLLSSCGENGLKPAQFEGKTNPVVSDFGLKTPTPMTRLQVLEKAGVVAKTSGYLSSHPDWYKNRTWQLKEYEVNQPWVDKYGNPHAAPSCWYNSTLRFSTDVFTNSVNGANYNYTKTYVTNICGIATNTAIQNGYLNNTLQWLSEQDVSVTGNYTEWKEASYGFMNITRAVMFGSNQALWTKNYIVEVWDGGHLFLIRTDSHNGQFCYEKYHYTL